MAKKACKEEDRRSCEFDGRAKWYWQKAPEPELNHVGEGWDGCGLGIKVSEEQYEGIIDPEDDW